MALLVLSAPGDEEGPAGMYPFHVTLLPHISGLV